MRPANAASTTLLSTLSAGLALAFAPVINIAAGTAPAQYEAVPVMAPGDVGATGHQVWHDARHN